MADQDLSDLVHQAAARPEGDAPMAAITARARRRRLRRRAAQAVVSLVVVLAGVGTAAAFLTPRHDVDLSPSVTPSEEEPGTPEPVETTAPESDGEPGDSDSESGDDEPAPQEPEPQGPEPLGTFDTRDVATENFPFGGGEHALLTDVRVAGHPGFDRVVLELDADGSPGYRVSYVQPPIVQDGSGDPVAVAGAAFLQVHLAPASGFDATGTEWEPTYTGPPRVSGDTSLVTELVRTGDFEANLTWVIGLRRQVPFAVTVLSDPVRLVVDIQTS